MIRSTARPLLSAHRGWAQHASLGTKSLGGSVSSSLVPHKHQNANYTKNNNNSFSVSARHMSSGGGWSAWTKSIPGFGSKPIPPEPDESKGETTFTDADTTTTAADASTVQASGADNTDAAIPSLDDSMSKIIPDYGAEEANAATSSTLDTASQIAAELAAWEPTSWPSDQILQLINYVHSTGAFDNYAMAIAATTLGFRLVLAPLFIKGQRNSSRMGHLQPELTAMKDEMDAMKGPPDQATQLQIQKRTRALFTKYDCNPLASLVAPLASAPIFISMFFALRFNAPEICPTLLENGGMLWFPDLTASDPYMIMPLLASGTFLLMTEVGKEQMMATDPARGRIMVNAFRALAVAMPLFTYSFNSAVFVYWTTNNTWSFLQAVALKQPMVKNYFGIWDPPKPVPGKPTGNFMDELKSLTGKKPKKEVNALAEDRVKAHNEIIAQQKLVKKKLMEKEGMKGGGRRK